MFHFNPWAVYPICVYSAVHPLIIALVQSQYTCCYLHILCYKVSVFTKATQSSQRPLCRGGGFDFRSDARLRSDQPQVHN